MLDVLEYIYRAIINVIDVLLTFVDSLVNFFSRFVDVLGFFANITALLPSFMIGFVMLFVTSRIVFLIVGRD